MALREVMAVPLLACLVISMLLLAEMTTASAVKGLSATPIFPMIPRSQTSKDFQVLLRVEAPPLAEKKRRVLIDLIVVLDIVGGTKDPANKPPSRLEMVKKATKFIVTHLHDDDRLAIVGFSTSQRVQGSCTNFGEHVEGWQKECLETVDTLEARRRNEFTSGLEEAIKILDGRAPDGRNSAGFIILLTDGEGTTPRGEIPAALSKYPVHTFGLSAAHDPKALLSIARRSRGTYSFVDEDDQDKLTGAIALCLGGLKTVVAAETTIKLETAERSGVRIERIVSGDYERKTSSDGKSGDISVGVLYAGEAKSFVVHLHVPAASGDDITSCNQQQLLTVSCYYGEELHEIPLNVIIQRPEVVDAVHRVPSAVVVQHIVQFNVLTMVQDIFIHGDQLVPITTSTASTLQIEWEKMVQVYQFWSGLDLGRLEAEIILLVSSLQQGGSSGVAYVYSWLSSYLTQRPTSMGSPANAVALFVTLEMNVMLQLVTAPLVNIYGIGCDCSDHCVEPLPPVFQLSGDTFVLNAAYQRQGIVEIINHAMNQMYQAIVHASNLRQCQNSATPMELNVSM